MSSENIFLDDWYACLQAHLAYVVEKSDTTNEVSLVEVLKRIGVSDQEIEHVRTQTLAALGREAEVVQVVETEPESVTDLEIAPEVNAPPGIAEDVIVEQMAQAEEIAALPGNPDEGHGQEQRTDPPAEPRQKPDPPPKLSQMSLF